MQPVSLVTIHHEGAGKPTDEARGAEGGYTIWIGTSRYTILRSPYESWGTLHYNHISVDVCLSGNRMDNPVTDNDIALIRNALNEVRSKGWVIDEPMVRDHHDSPGSSTVCPGTKTMERWNDVVAACVKSFTPLPNPNLHPDVHKEEVMKFWFEPNDAPEGNPACGVEITIDPDTGQWNVETFGGAGFTPLPGAYIGKAKNVYRTKKDWPDGFAHIVIVNDKLEKFDYRLKTKGK